MKCYFHSNDLDGHCSGAIVRYKYPDCEMYGIDYGEEFPWEEVGGHDVYMVDFSLQPYKLMQKLNTLCKLIWIDHHKSAIDEHEKYQDHPINTTWDILGHRQVGESACELTWEYLFPDQEIPIAVTLLGRYDVWDKKNKQYKWDTDILPFQMGMRLCATDPRKKDSMAIWSELFEPKSMDIFGTLLDIGETIIQYQSNTNEKYCSNCAFETELDGLNCIALNLSNSMCNSESFKSVWDENKHDAMLSFGWKGGQWVVCLYSDKPNIDVSLVAKSRGGGGHNNAAGFQCGELPFELR